MAFHAPEPDGSWRDISTVCDARAPSSKTKRVASLSPASVEESSDGAIHFVLLEQGNPDTEIWIGAQPMDGRPGTLTPLRGATTALLHGAYGLAFAREVPFVSVDHGATWSTLAEVPPYLEPAPDGSPPRRKTREVLSVSAVGAETSDLVRLGWWRSMLRRLGPQAATVTDNPASRPSPATHETKHA